MSKENLHSDFDKLFRNKFESAETPIAETKWDEVDNALQKNIDPLDSIIRERFKEGLQPPDFKIPDFVPPGDSSKSSNSKKWGWFVLVLFVAITPLAYNFFTKSNKHMESNTLSKKDHNLERQKGIEKDETIKDYSGATEERNEIPEHYKESTTSANQSPNQDVITNTKKGMQTEKRANLSKTLQQTNKKTTKNTRTNFKNSISSSNTINETGFNEEFVSDNPKSNNREPKKANNRLKRRSNSDALAQDFDKTNSKEKLLASNYKANTKNQKKAKNVTTRATKSQTSEISSNTNSEKNTLNPSTEKQPKLKESVALTGDNRLRTNLEKQSIDLENNLSICNSSQSKREGNNTNPESPTLITKENTTRGGKIKEDKNKEQSAQSSKPKTIKKKTKKVTKPAQINQQKELVNNNSRQKLKPFRLCIGTYASRPFTKTNSTNPIYENRYRKGEIKKWKVSAEIQAEYRFSKKWSFGSGISSSTYSTSINNNIFERNLTDNVHLDSVNKMVLFQSSLGQAQANNLSSFEFGRTILSNPTQPRDTLNKFAFEESQSFNFIQIPLFIQHTGGKGKFHYSIGAGALLSLVTKQNSDVVVYNTAFPNDRVTITNYHRTNDLLWGVTSRLGFHYDISNRFGIYTRPTFNYSITDFSKISLLSIYLHNLRIPIGINYVF